jgi:hypothetical protein
MKKAAEAARLQRRTVIESRDGLRRVLEKVRQGDLTAGPGYVAGPEGAPGARAQPSRPGLPLSPPATRPAVRRVPDRRGQGD